MSQNGDVSQDPFAMSTKRLLPTVQEETEEKHEDLDMEEIGRAHV